MPPFGSPKREGRHEHTKRSTRGVAGSQVDPPQGGTGARVLRHRRSRDRWLHRPPSHRQPRLREGCLNGFPRALAEVVRHRVGGCSRRVPDAAPKGFSDVRFVVQSLPRGAFAARPMSPIGAAESRVEPRSRGNVWARGRRCLSFSLLTYGPRLPGGADPSTAFAFPFVPCRSTLRRQAGHQIRPRHSRGQLVR